MSARAALWAESLKARRALLPRLTLLGFSFVPIIGGFFMVILQDPERARSLGFITAKAQITAGTADWPSFLGLLAQGTAVGGALLFSLVTAWVFGREHADRTAKELLAVPTRRGTIIAAKFVVTGMWLAAMGALVVVLGLVVGAALDLPGGSPDLVQHGALDILGAAGLTAALMSPVALLASAGRGYLPPLGWAILMVFLAQIAAATGWGAWFPWSVPALFSGIAGPRAAQVGAHSYLLVGITSLIGLAATFLWWMRADQTR